MQEFIKKLLSGRYFLTIVGGLVFAYCAVQSKLEPQAISAILTAIFMSYFQRHDREGEK